MYEPNEQGKLAPSEVPVYGSSRIGLYHPSGQYGDYELKDHLGNVRAIIGNASGEADVKYQTDYFAFGKPLDSKGTASRFQYQGAFAEKDDETGYTAFELRQYDPVVGRWLSMDPYGQHWSPYLAMGNNPASYFDPDGGFDTRIGAWWYSVWNGDTVNGNRQDGFTVNKVLNDGDPSQGVLNSVEVVMERDPNQIDLGTSPNVSLAEQRWNYNLQYNEAFRAELGLSNGIELDYTLESFLIPVTKGASLIYNGTIRGASKTALGLPRLGGSAKNINYYTQKAIDAGYSTSITGQRVKAGIFVQLNHNLGRALSGSRGWKTLYSGSPATIIGRQWQNQAIGGGLLGVGIGTGSLIYNTSQP